MSSPNAVSVGEEYAQISVSDIVVAVAVNILTDGGAGTSGDRFGDLSSHEMLIGVVGPGSPSSTQESQFAAFVESIRSVLDESRGDPSKIYEHVLRACSDHAVDIDLPAFAVDGPLAEGLHEVADQMRDFDDFVGVLAAAQGPSRVEASENRQRVATWPRNRPTRGRGSGVALRAGLLRAPLSLGPAGRRTAPHPANP